MCSINFLKKYDKILFLYLLGHPSIIYSHTFTIVIILCRVIGAFNSSHVIIKAHCKRLCMAALLTIVKGHYSPTKDKIGIYPLRNHDQKQGIAYSLN